MPASQYAPAGHAPPHSGVAEAFGTSLDAALREAFERGDDIHAAVASQVLDVPIDEVDDAASDQIVRRSLTWRFEP